MNRIKTTATKLKNHMKTHKSAYAWGGIASAILYLQQANRIAFQKFLIERDIDPMEFYCPEYYDELNPKEEGA